MEFATFFAAVTGVITKELRLFFGAEVEGEFILLDETNDSDSFLSSRKKGLQKQKRAQKQKRTQKQKRAQKQD